MSGVADHYRGRGSEAQRTSYAAKAQFTLLRKALRCVALRCGYFWLRCDALRMLVHNACVSMREMRRVI